MDEMIKAAVAHHMKETGISPEARARHHAIAEARDGQLRAWIAAIHASGHRIVPVEPTEEMVEAGRRHLGSYTRDGVPHDGPLTPAVVYRAMLTAYVQRGE